MKVLVSPTSFGDCSNEPVDLLKSHFEVKSNPYKRKLTESEVIELASDCDAILAGLEPLNKRVMDSLPNLKCISRVGSGIDNVDLQYAKEKKIKVVSTPHAPSRAVAELAVGLTFDLLRKISLADREIRQGKWKKQFGNLLDRKKVGIIGLGRIGKITAELFRGLGNDVYGCDIKPDMDWAKKFNISLREKNDVLRECGIIILHVSSNPDKSFLIGESEFRQMQKDSILVNVSRGDVVDEQALFSALKASAIGGAACDVFVNEPYNGTLKELNNVVLTPHIGSYTIETRIQMETEAVQNLIDCFTKE